MLKVTGIKIIQEIQIFETFNIQEFLPFLDYIENPNNEDIQLIKKSNSITQKIYHNKTKITIGDNIDIWRGLMLNEPLLDRIKQSAVLLIANKNITDTVKDLYQEMLILAKEYLPQFK